MIIEGEENEGGAGGTSFFPSPSYKLPDHCWNLIGTQWKAGEGGVNQGPANKFHVLSPVRREASYYPGGGSDRRSKRRPGRFLSADREGGAPVDGPRRPAN